MAGDGWTSRLLTGVAELLDAAGIGVWRPDGAAYAASEIGIVDRDIPQSPDRIITLADYVVAGDPGLVDITVGMQIRIRGTADPRVCRDIGDQVFELLDSAGPMTIGGIQVSDVYRQSYTSLGKDGTGRWEASHNYYIEAMRPTVHRTI